MKIAETLGGRTADEFEETLSVSELREWAEYFKMQHEQHEEHMRKSKKGKSSGLPGRKSPPGKGGRR